MNTDQPTQSHRILSIGILIEHTTRTGLHCWFSRDPKRSLLIRSQGVKLPIKTWLQIAHTFFLDIVGIHYSNKRRHMLGLVYILMMDWLLDLESNRDHISGSRYLCPVCLYLDWHLLMEFLLNCLLLKSLIWWIIIPATKDISSFHLRIY